jgi:hypothetical protein
MVQLNMRRLIRPQKGAFQAKVYYESQDDKVQSLEKEGKT